MIKKVGKQYELWTKDGSRRLGGPYSRGKAIAQEIAIKESMKRKGK